MTALLFFLLAINPLEITSDSHSVIVPKAWMQEYQGLEKGKTIPADHLIWREGKRFHIPIKVARHYLELRKK